MSAAPDTKPVRRRRPAPQRSLPPRAQAHPWQPRPQQIRPQRPEPAADPTIAPTPRMVRLHELGGGECHWPYGDGPEFLFCGTKAEEPTDQRPKPVYCPFHGRKSEQRERLA